MIIIALTEIPNLVPGNKSKLISDLLMFIEDIPS